MFQKGGGQLRSPLLPPRQADGVRNKNPARGPFAKGGKLGRGRNPSKNAKRRVRPGNTWARHRFLTERPAQTAHCMSSEHFGQLAWQFERMSGSSGLKVQAAIAC